MSNDLGFAAIFTALTTAIGWLAKRLFDSQVRETTSAVERADRAEKKVDELRAIIDHTYETYREAADDAELENRKLRTEIDDLRTLVDRRSHEHHAVHQGSPVRERRAGPEDRRGPHPGRRFGDERPPVQDAEPSPKRDNERRGRS